MLSNCAPEGAIEDKQITENYQYSETDSYAIARKALCDVVAVTMFLHIKSMQALVRRV